MHQNLDPTVRSGRTLRSTLVEPFKQIKIGLYVMGITLTFLVAAVYLFVAAFMQQYEHVMELFNVVDPGTQWELVTNDVFIENAVKIGVLFVSYLVILFMVVFKTTHKVYGPLVGIERFVDQIARGEYGNRVVIRRRDELQRLADRLNKMAETLEAKYGRPDRRKSESSQELKDSDHFEAS